MPSFNPFHHCKLKPCLLMKPGPPFVILESSLPPEFEPFPFKSVRAKYSLDGISIGLLDYFEELDDALRICPGASCTYDDLVLVLRDAAEVGNHVSSRCRTKSRTIPEHPFYSCMESTWSWVSGRMFLPWLARAFVWWFTLFKLTFG